MSKAGRSIRCTHGMLKAETVYNKNRDINGFEARGRVADYGALTAGKRLRRLTHPSVRPRFRDRGSAKRRFLEAKTWVPTCC
jgi:hypothetical protein